MLGLLNNLDVAHIAKHIAIDDPYKLNDKYSKHFL